MLRWAMATMLPYVMERIEAPTRSRTQAGLKATSDTKNMRIRIANAAPLGAIERKAVTGVGAP